MHRKLANIRLANKKPTVWLLGLFWFFCLVSHFANAQPLPESLAWLPEDVDKASIVNEYPLECLNPTADATVTLGRLAFESSALLGGQAARMGLACASCHLSARGNPHFYLAQISDRPGRADVTHSLLNKQGFNDQFLPVVIPDLAMPEQLSIKDRTSLVFKEKLVQLITIEFDGQPPLPEVLVAIQVYLLNIDQRYCMSHSDDKAVELSLVIQQGWQQDWQRLEQGVNLLEAAIASENSQLATFLVRIIRLRLEKLYRAYAIAKQEQLDKLLMKQSRQLANLLNDRSDKAQQLEVLQLWIEKTESLPMLLEKYRKNSAYNADYLRQFL